jgi:hypothetical protein
MSVGAGRAHAQGEGRSDQDSLNEDIHSLAAACRALPALWEQGVYDLAGAEGSKAAGDHLRRLRSGTVQHTPPRSR